MKGIITSLRLEAAGTRTEKGKEWSPIAHLANVSDQGQAMGNIYRYVTHEAVEGKRGNQTDSER